MKTTAPTRDVATTTNCAHMPEAFLEWQCHDRQEMFADLGQGKMPRFLASHLPVLSTLNHEEGAEFPIRSSTKGVGLFPKSEHLAEHVAEINECLERWGDDTTRRSLEQRIEAAVSLYSRPERIDSSVFGGIEIFRGKSYQNLRHDGRATLLFTGFAPRYLSYQFDCLAEILDADDLRFEFLRGMRLLFDTQSFHIRQPQYPFGYVFHLRQVIDKTPKRLRAVDGKRK